MLDLVVVILNYNTRDLLRECLRSLREQTGLAFKTIVVDNCSTDASADMVAAEFPEVELIRSQTNGGFAHGNNLGLRSAGFGVGEVASARHAMLLNPDTVVPPNALSQMVAFADANPDVGVVGPRLLLLDGTLDKACRRSFPTPEVSFYRFSGLGKLFPKSKRFGRYNMTYLPETQTADVDSVVGACMLVRADAIAKAGLLDEQFFMYGEDLDWCLRVKQAGYRVVYLADVIVHHKKRAASRTSAKAQYEFQRAMWLFYKKHYLAATSAPVNVLVKVGLGLRGGKKLWDEMNG
ncbi:MAG TPA: glycosyltransferase family 2 protein [Thermoflexales bacterium]|nr:glycosyltransferase family 2 protein [Thermoflexales bacterium]HQW36881.1 glycosyltransferase family 2 protein [Thermoflexales bacterium]HQZ23222.1 glycosyltransferase family 2 protein [Thermoflexales bacterium]HRA00209.1 glycosyltransferase family 2 protein [Thermoflexales bacterium]